MRLRGAEQVGSGFLVTLLEPKHDRPDQGRPLDESALGAFRDSLFPVWVFDIDRARVIWANAAGLAIWAADSLDELRGRDMAPDMSSSVRARLFQYQGAFWAGAHFDEVWTIYPRGIPRALQCRFRGCLLDQGRMAMLCEALPFQARDEDLLKSAQALLYTSVMVTTYDTDGTCTYANPAAQRAFPAAGQASPGRFHADALRAVLAGQPEAVAEGRFRSDVTTSRGVRVHDIEVRQSYDPVDGRRNFLITEVDVTEQEAAKRDLAILASRDPLTGLRNRAFLAAAARSFIQDARARGETAALLLLDIDRFKLVNDTLGHSAGDALLTEIARRLALTLPTNGLLARLGGDEFCCLLSSAEGERAFQRQAQAVLKEMRRPLRVDGNDLGIAASIGVSLTTDESTGFDDLLRKADFALFDAKGSGGNALRVYRPEMARRSHRFVQIESELRAALSRGRVELFYQPRISFQTGRIVAAEALIRLNSPQGSPVSPGEFIPVAEATGRIALIGRWVLREAARHLVELRKTGGAINLSINVSPKQFADPSFLALLRQVRPMIDAVQGDIELEITENVLIDSDRRLQRVLKQIADLGYRLAIDDFGTAYSNLASLTRYPISCIKIDRTLIAQKDFRLLVTGVMTIARAFGARIVAEGVETEEQRHWLQEALCDEYQGFLFSKPVPFSELQRLVGAGH